MVKAHTRQAHAYQMVPILNTSIKKCALLCIAQNLSRICSNGLFFRKFLSQHVRGLHFGFRPLHSAQKHFRKLSRTELILQAFANLPELSQAFANEKLAQSFADLSRLHVLLSRRHDKLTSLQIVTWEVLAAAQTRGWLLRPNDRSFVFCTSCVFLNNVFGHVLLTCC